MKLHRVVAISVAAVALIGAAVHAPLARGDDFIRMKSKQPVVAWALDETSGRVFAASAKSPIVEEYDPKTGESIRQIDVGGTATMLLIKGNRLIASLPGHSAIAVVDLEKNTLAGQISLEGDQPSDICCSKADNPFVYVCGSPQPPVSEELLQVDIRALKIVKRVADVQSRGSEESGLLMSDDGRWLWTEFPGLYSVDEQRGTFLAKYGVAPMGQEQSVVPGSRYWMVNGGLFPINGREGAEIRRFVGTPVAVNRKFDLAVSGPHLPVDADADGAHGYVLTFQRFSDAKVFKTVPLPKSAKKPPVYLNDDQASDDTDNRGWNGRHLLQFDAQRNRLFLATGGEAFLLNLAGLDLPQQPLLMFKPIQEIKLTIGQPLAVPLELTDAALQATCKFELASAPRGAKLDSARITWTPDETSLGEHSLVATAAKGESKDQIRIPVRVRRAAVSLGGLIERLRISPSGERALVVTVSLDADATGKPDNSRVGVPADPKTQTHLVLVDLKQSRIIANRLLNGPLGADICLTDQAAYMVPDGTAAVYQLSLETLAETKHVFLKNTIAAMAALPRHRLGILGSGGGMGDDGGECTVLDESTLNHVEQPGGGSVGRFVQRRINDASSSWFEPLNGDAFRLGALVLDNQTGRPELVWDALQVPTFGRIRYEMPEPWDRTVSDQAIEIVGRPPIVRWNRAETIVLRNYPATVSVRAEPATAERSGRGESDTNKRITLEFRDLTTGTVRKELVLDQLPYWGDVPSMASLISGDGRVQIAAAGRMLAVSFADQLYAVPLPEEQLAKLPVPLQIVPKLDKLQAAAGEKVEFVLKAVGGTGVRHFSLAAPTPGIAVEETSGKVTIDSGEIWQTFKRDLQSPRPQFITFGGDPDLVGTAQQAYYELTGKKLDDKFPLAAGLSFTVSDADQSTADLTAQFLVLGPKTEIASILAAERARSEQARAALQSRAEGAPANSEFAQQLALAGQRTNLANQRLAELDAEVTRSGHDLGELKDSIARLGGRKEQIDALQRSVDDGGHGTESLQTKLADIDKTVERQRNWLLAVAGFLAAAQLLVFALLFRRGGNAANKASEANSTSTLKKQGKPKPDDGSQQSGGE